MILKSFSHKRPAAFKYLVNYILRHQPDTRSVTTHNLYGLEPQDFTAQFQENQTYRKKRKGMVYAYHEVMSWHPEDARHLTDEIITDLGEKYLELRTDGDCLGLSCAHWDKENPHLHLMFSGNRIASSKAISHLSNKAFMQLRKEMERYQLEKYPQLQKSIVYLNKEKTRQPFGTAKSKDKEKQVGRRGKVSDKKRVQNMLIPLAKKAFSYSDFLAVVQTEYSDIDLYQYRGKIVGIMFNGRKYRFATIIDRELIKQLKRADERQKGLKHSKNIGRTRER